jgi:hypothetical protein
LAANAAAQVCSLLRLSLLSIASLLSSTLGSKSNSPSALFVASDGSSLRLYQAVIDGRTLLHEHISRKGKEPFSPAAAVSEERLLSGLPPDLAVISQQSTARPGCILELDAISDARQVLTSFSSLPITEMCSCRIGSTSS